jgi:hypothetical protein
MKKILLFLMLCCFVSTFALADVTHPSVVPAKHRVKRHHANHHAHRAAKHHAKHRRYRSV